MSNPTSSNPPSRPVVSSVQVSSPVCSDEDDQHSLDEEDHSSNEYEPDSSDAESESSDSGEENNGSSFNPISASTSVSHNSSALNDSLPIFVSPATKGVKRRRNSGNWKRNIAKNKRNTGEEYNRIGDPQKIRAARSMKPGCSEKCRLNLSDYLFFLLLT